MLYILIGLFGLASVPIVTGLVLAASRWVAAEALGMRGVRFLFGGAVENAEAAALWRRGLVAGAGVVASYLVPALLFAAALRVGGREVRATVVSVIPDRPAAAAGMATGDRVLSVGGRPVTTWEQLSEAVRARAGEPVEIVVRRGAGEERFTVTPSGAPGQGKIGVAAVPQHEEVSAGRALADGLRAPAQHLAGWVATAATIARGGEEVASGPVGIVQGTAAAPPPDQLANALWVEARLFSYAWPFTVIVALLTVPRRKRAGAPG